MPVVDVDREAARDAAQHELGKPIYPKPSPSERLFDRVETLVRHLLAQGATVPGGWFTVSVLAIVVIAAVAVTVRVTGRVLRTGRVADARLFGPAVRSAAEHRATAEDRAAGSDWAAAIRHRLRAVARQLEETGVLNAAPGRTANELAGDAGAALPWLVTELGRAAATFNEVSYGELPGTEDGYRLIVDLDDQLLSGRAVTTRIAAR